MSKEMREQIDKVKNWKQFLNENKDNNYKEIEFVCHNSDSDTSTDRKSQKNLYEDIEKGKRNTSWSMRQASGEAVQGFIAFLDGKSIDDNPYKDAKTMKDGVKYKDWMAGYRNGEDATPDQIKMFNWIYSR